MNARAACPHFLLSLVATIVSSLSAAASDTNLNQPPQGFDALFNGMDLDKWRGQIAEDPSDTATITEEMTPEQIQQNQIEADDPQSFQQLPEAIRLGPCSAVSVDSHGRIFLFNRGKHPIICLNAKGRYVRSWGEGEIVSSHGLRIDADDNVWVTDMEGHRVLKYHGAGKLLLTLGTGKPGDGEDQFNRPTDVAFGKRGEFYVSDGYGNSRVMKFSPNGALIAMWGRRGNAPGEFHLPHCILVDAKGRVLVGDRENNRIQVFDADGVANC